jgi:hypothetical protein
MQLATGIDIPNNIVRITKLKTISVEDKDEAVGSLGAPLPYAVIVVQLYGADKKDGNNNNSPYSNPYGTPFRLQVYDAIASIVLRKKTAPQTFLDVAEIQSIVVSGAYTAIMSAYNANVSGSGQTRKRCIAVDAVLVPSGVLGPEFAAS